MYSLNTNHNDEFGSSRVKRELTKADVCKYLSFLSPFSETVGGVAGSLGSLAEETTKIAGALAMIPGLTSVMGSVALASTIVKGAGSIIEVAMDCSDVSTDEIKDILKARFNEVNRKLDQNTLILLHVSNIVSKTLIAVEETRKEMREHFQKVLDFIKNQEVKELVSQITLIVDFVDLKKKAWQKADKNEYANIIEHELSHNELYNLVKEDGDLFKALFFIIQHGYAIPQDIKDDNAFSAIFSLFYGMQTYFSIVFSLLEHHTYLAHYYYKKGELEAFNFYFARLRFYFFKFKHILTENNNSLVDKVISVLKKVEKIPFVRYLKNQLYDDVSNRTQSLISLKEKISKMKLEIINEDPVNNIIVSFLDVKADNRISTPLGDWVNGAKVSYAVQYENNGTFSLISDWTNPQPIQHLANPVLEIDTSNYNRYIYRKITKCSQDEKTELVQVLEGSQPKFRDLNRDFYNLAGDIINSCQTLSKIMDDLLGQGSSISAQFELQKTPIHAAAAAGNECVLNRILAKDPNQIEVKDIDGNTPLHLAAENNKSNLVKLLLSKGADVNAKNKLHLTPLHIACRRQFQRTVSSLLESRDIDVNVADESGLTPLHVSVSNGIYNSDVTKKLLRMPDININAQNDIGLTALHFATLQNLTENVELLIKQTNININEGDKNKVTPLHYAAMKGYLSIVELLINKKQKIDINCVCEDKKYTPLMYAVYFTKKEIVEKLLAESKIQVDIASPDMYTALHLAIANGRKDIVEMLLNKKAKISDKTVEGYTPLHLSVVRKETDITNLLFLNNGNTLLEEKSVNGSTPLHLSARHGNLNNFMALCLNGANKDAEDDEGNLSFHEAISGGNLDIVKYLMEYNADFIQRKNKALKTPIYFSLKNIHIHGREMYDFLISKGAERSFQDIQQKSRLYVFIKEGNIDAIRFLVYEGTVEKSKDIDKFFLIDAVENGQLEIVKFVVSKKLINLDEMDSDNKHTLREYNIRSAVVNQHLPLVIYLDQKDLDVSWFNPLYWASSKHNLDIMKYFVKVKKADVNQKFPDDEYTALCISLKISRNDEYKFEIVKFLVENGGNVNVECGVSSQKVTPIQMAMERRDRLLVEYLFQNGVNPDANDAIGNSPLAYAVMNNDLDFVKHLVEDKKVNKEIRNHQHYTAVHIAAEKDFLEVFEYLVTQGAEMLAKVDGDSDTCDVADKKKKNVLMWLRREKGKCMPKFKRNAPDQLIILNESINDLTPNKITSSGNTKIKNNDFENNVDLPSTLLLLDLVVRKITNKKFINSISEKVPPLEAKAVALTLTDYFEKFLKTDLKIQENLDLFDVYSKVYKAISSGSEEKLLNTLCSYVNTHSEVGFQGIEKFCQNFSLFRGKLSNPDF
ncbi:alpha-latroinsectotoxin-Lt1a-like [Parasteatoda tepidariorum]|uniref:alpha-latroinsectotoxin-Lt1a-like n=1 Tax=Parasteatoda tepidariorum TaxID=114398 RepID=UPI001C7211AA|nr:alpha-latroinsectotoxin-Lt1a-like [Parasteatoda tepidariorum]